MRCKPTPQRPSADELPDARDGLRRLERVVLYQLHQLQKERPGRSIPTIELYGRVVELIDCSEDELQSVLQAVSRTCPRGG